MSAIIASVEGIDPYSQISWYSNTTGSQDQISRLNGCDGSIGNLDRLVELHTLELPFSFLAFVPPDVSKTETLTCACETVVPRFEHGMSN